MIPKGSTAKLVVGRTSDDTLALNLQSVTFQGQTFGVNTFTGVDEKYAAAARRGGISVPASFLLSFRLTNPIMIVLPV
jgi:hypothetical protein